jgi:hypothetical protein
MSVSGDRERSAIGDDLVRREAAVLEERRVQQQLAEGGRPREIVPDAHAVRFEVQRAAILQRLRAHLAIEDEARVAAVEAGAQAHVAAMAGHELTVRLQPRAAARVDHGTSLKVRLPCAELRRCRR